MPANISALRGLVRRFECACEFRDPKVAFGTIKCMSSWNIEPDTFCISAVLFCFRRWPASHDADVVDKDIESSQNFVCNSGQAASIPCLGRIARRIRVGLNAVLIAVGDRHVGTRRAQVQCDLSTDAAPAADACLSDKSIGSNQNDATGAPNSAASGLTPSPGPLGRAM